MKTLYLFLFLSFICVTVYGQSLMVNGLVYDAEDNQPIPGVTVLEKNTSNGTITDIDGNFGLEVENGSIVVFRFVGMETKEIRATSEEPFEIAMSAEVSSLDEVVVIGYGKKKKRDIIGSVSSVSSDDMTNKATSSLTSALQGKAAGVQISSSSGVPGSKVNIKIRGENSINSSTDPLWVIDGMPVYSGGGLEKTIGSTGQDPMSMINVDDIESVEILKDAAATSIYGSRGSNGVIIVTTKSGKPGVSNTKIDFSSGITTLNRTPDDIGFANTSQYLSLVDQARFNSGMT
ncbi:MAG TPA: TonB-dependent receptor plug domain-containing protein, partial [Prolixibacteraceae bacterium]|nr:TonB-dependent receptor plug domain-containing protein [Prolixibacteraceae bacterium]